VTDSQTGLVYMQQRYYDEDIGRFLSVDPVVAYSNPVDAFNRYWYANNNPYRFADPDGRKIVENGTRGEKKEIRQLTKQIKNSGPEGKALIKALEKGPDVLVSQGSSVTKNDGTVVALSDTGGGLTIPASESMSGKIEIVSDKSNLVSYTATDGSAVTETPGGLVLHEFGHGELLMKGDPSHESPGPAAEQAVRDLTNPIREDLGLKPEASP
jgi:RHS repeat-associated protein